MEWLSVNRTGLIQKSEKQNQTSTDAKPTRVRSLSRIGLVVWCYPYPAATQAQVEMHASFPFLILACCLAGYLGLSTIIFLILQFKINRQPAPAKNSRRDKRNKNMFFFCGSAQEMFYSFQPHVLWLRHGFKIFGGSYAQLVRTISIQSEI